MMIESSSDDLEIIPQAMKEYYCIIKGIETPQKLVENELLNLKLETKLELFRLERDFYKKLVNSKDNRIDQLLNVIEKGLTKEHNFRLDYSPSIDVDIVVNPDISNALTCINELKEAVGTSSDVFSRLKEIENSLNTLENGQDLKKTTRNSAINKFRRFLIDALDENSILGKTVKGIDSGVEILKDMMLSYNKIATSFGMPNLGMELWEKLM